MNKFFQLFLERMDNKNIKFQREDECYRENCVIMETLSIGFTDLLESLEANKAVSVLSFPDINIERQNHKTSSQVGLEKLRVECDHEKLQTAGRAVKNRKTKNH